MRTRSIRPARERKKQRNGGERGAAEGEVESELQRRAEEGRDEDEEAEAGGGGGGNKNARDAQNFCVPEGEGGRRAADG